MARRASTDRLVRLLSLPAWVADNDGATLREAAAHFGVTPETIRADVATLWVSGLPGGMPDDLVDFSATAFEAGRLSLAQPLGLDRPVRLSRQEAIALLLSLRVLGRVLADDPASAAALRGARNALRAAIGDGPTSGGAAADPAPAPAAPPSPALQAVRRALAEQRRLRLTYVSATDTRTVREVDPLELTTDGAHLTLRAWCLSAAAERSFRLDRILEAACGETPSASHRRRRRPTRPDARPTAVLTLAPGGRWLVERLVCESVAERADGALRAVVRGRDRTWLIGLVLSAGRHLVAVEPPDLARDAAAAAARALARYGARRVRPGANVGPTSDGGSGRGPAEARLKPYRHTRLPKE